LKIVTNLYSKGNDYFPKLVNKM